MSRFAGCFFCLVILSLTFGSESLPKRLPDVKHPANNPSTPAKVALGRKLFFDPRLSTNNRIACATCHDPKKGFSNGQRFAVGVNGKPGKRNVPGLFNVAYQRSLFWDGRVATLEEQALKPIENPLEMNLPLKALVKKLSEVKEYRQAFQKVFSGPITAQRIAQAIASFERTLISRNTPFDRYLNGEKKALSASAIRGMKLFFGEARCSVCHRGPNFTDDQFHNVGFGGGDAGREHGKFKTPSLREVGRTAPYGHHGKLKSLKDVVKHYNFGGVTDEENEHRDEELQVLYLSEQQVDDLVTFLQTGLTSKAP